jgi:hypothetical protein
MGKLTWFLTLLLMGSLCLSNRSRAEENVKLAQTGMQFLSVVSDARAAAMAGAVTTVRMESASLFFNPAGMAETDRLFHLSGSYNLWIADIKHYTASASYRPMSGDLGVFGLSFQYVDYGEILGTSISTADIGYVDDGPLKAYGIALGLGYAKALSEAFSVGGQIRWVSQKLGQSLVPSVDGTTMQENKASNLGVFDFGTIFKPGFKSFAFGMSVRNFSKEITFQDQSFELPLTFTLGVSMDIMDLLNDRSLVSSAYVSVDAVHNRDYHEQLFFAGDVTLLDVLSLRGGYITNSDEQGFTLGFGVHRSGVAADFAYVPFGVFNHAMRYTIRFSM